MQSTWIDAAIEDWIARYEAQFRLRQIEPLPSGKREERRQRVERDFWFFDRTYFPQELYRQGYAKPAVFHRKIVEIAQKPGVQVILGPRKHGKTATLRKLLLWELLTGRKQFVGVMSEDIAVAQSWVRFLIVFLRYGRIRQDFHVQFDRMAMDELQVEIDGKMRIVKAFSLGRSVRGQMELLERPEKIYADDVETWDSSFSTEAVQRRLEKLSEAYQSMADGATLVVLGNNFHRKGLMNQLLEQQKQGVLHSGWQVHVFRAWERGKPLWRARYAARSEEELKRLVAARDEADWQGNFQQNPIERAGFFFRREYYQEAEVPRDVRGVIYVDQNLARKGKGDTTAMTYFAYSPRQDAFYVVRARCRSYRSVEELFSDLMSMWDEKCRGICLDGSVAQESHWSEHLRQFAQRYGEQARIFRHLVEFRRYKVDEVATAFQLIWNNRRVFFPVGFSETEEGRRYLDQVFAFEGKKAGKTDDAPDSLICAFQFLIEKRLSRRYGIENALFLPVGDVYQL